MADKKVIPASVTDTLLHTKVSENEERVILPFTRYANVMNAPRVVKDGKDALGAPYAFLETDTETLTTEQIRSLCGGIL